MLRGPELTFWTINRSSVFLGPLRTSLDLSGSLKTTYDYIKPLRMTQRDSGVLRGPEQSWVVLGSLGGLEGS